MWKKKTAGSIVQGEHKPHYYGWRAQGGFYMCPECADLGQNNFQQKCVLTTSQCVTSVHIDSLIKSQMVQKY